MPSFSCGAREHIKNRLDELLDAAEEQVNVAEEIVDIICDLQAEVNLIIGA
jgi:hypothetical protein